MSAEIVATNFEDAQRQGLTTFKTVFDEVITRKGFNQFRFAEKLDLSQSYLSKIERGKRDLTTKLAENFSQVLGGDAETWMKVYNETKFGNSTPSRFFVGRLLDSSVDATTWGTPVRQLRGAEIVDLFERAARGEITFEKDGEVIECGIEHFPETKDGRARYVSETSYDMTLGGVAYSQDKNGDWIWEETSNDILIAPHSVCALMAKGHVQLPEWLEAEVHQPTSIALKPLFIANGPVIDPGFGGLIRVTAYNPSNSDVSVAIDEPLLTLRFWIASNHSS